MPLHGFSVKIDPMPIITMILRKQELQLEEEVTVKQALERLKLPPQSYLVVRNGELLTEDLCLKDGDVVKLVPVISGGGKV